jgi:hypothetical protein
MAFFRWLRSKSTNGSGDPDSAGFSRLDSRFADDLEAPPSRAPSGYSASGFGTQAHSPSQLFAIRKNLIRMVLRDNLLMAGIPADWIDGEVLISSSKRRGYAGLYLRFQIRRWDERLPACMLTLQRKFEQRIASLDPTAPEWLVGISWQFAFDEDVPLPKLPHPAFWTTAPKPVAEVHADFAPTEPSPARRARRA